jgi:imidazoleglycerol-phosphate dehydratase
VHSHNQRAKHAHPQREPISKAFGRALRKAAERDERAAGVIPSTKGAL